MLVAIAIWFCLVVGVTLGLLVHPKFYALVTRTPYRSADHEGWQLAPISRRAYLCAHDKDTKSCADAALVSGPYPDASDLLGRSRLRDFATL